METWAAAIISASGRDRTASLVVDRESYSDAHLDLKPPAPGLSNRETRIDPIRSVAQSLSIQLRRMCRRAYQKRRRSSPCGRSDV